MRLPVALLLFLALPTCAAAAPLLVRADRIHTLDPAAPQAEALLLEDDRIVAAGDFAELQAAHPQAKVEDLRGRSIVPGLIDAHGHVLGLGLSLLRADLVGTRSKAEVIERLRAAEARLPDGAWLLGRGWDQNDWPEDERRFPSAADLDAAFPQRPVLLERIDGHAAWANRAAMAKVQRKLDGDWQPEGGRIERIDGQPSGIFIDAAAALLDAAVPPLDQDDKRAAYELAFARLLQAGLTGVHDAGTSLEDLELLRELADAGKLPLRLYTMADGASRALDWLCEHGLYAHPDGRLQMRAVKLYADGALGSRGAALLADYSDDPGNRGLLVTPPAALRAAMAKARDCGVQVATHAIGDRANRQVLDAYAELLDGDTTRRWRIEHAQVLAPAELGRFAGLGVIASMQPTHATSDMPWAQARLGRERVVGAYAWRTLRDAGTRLAFGSDFPVERHDPIPGLRAAIRRQDEAGQPDGGWFPAQRLSAHEALRGFTSDAAWAGFAEAEVGMLKAGMRADFTVLRGDPLTLQPAELDALQVDSTWVDGEAAWRAGTDGDAAR